MPRHLPQTLAQLLPIHHHRLRIQRHIQRPCKPGPARIPPAVVRSPLHRDIPPLHQPLLATLQLQLQLALDHDAEIQRHGTVPHRLPARMIVDVAQDGATRDHEGRLVDQVVGVGGEVPVMRQRGREGGHAVAEEEVAADGAALPVDGFGDRGFEGGGTGRGVVGGNEALDGGEVLFG